MEPSADLKAYLTGHWLTDLANFSAFAFHGIPDLNWVGFYLDHGDRLRLGPFVGKPACTEIAYGRGVCGAAFSRKAALIVPDVHEFPGHIACDSASRSEMVLPLLAGGKLLGVLDLDSPLVGRFSDADRQLAQKWLDALAASSGASLASRPWCAK